MSKYEELQAALSRIKEEAAQRTQAAAEKTAEIATEEARRIAERRLVDSNWPVFQTSVINELREINREVFMGRGEVVGWQQLDCRYKVDDTRKYWTEGENTSMHLEVEVIGSHYVTERVHVAQLILGKLGRIVVFRVGNQASLCFSHDRPNERILKPTNDPSDSRHEHLSLTTTEESLNEIEHYLAGELKALYEEAYLGKK